MNHPTTPAPPATDRPSGPAVLGTIGFDAYLALLAPSSALKPPRVPPEALSS